MIIWRLIDLDQYDVEIFKAILEKDKPRNGEIVDHVFASLKDPKSTKETVKVSVTVRLEALRKTGVLDKEIVTPKNVRYFFKNDKARQSALTKVNFERANLKIAITSMLPDQEPIPATILDIMLQISYYIQRNYHVLMSKAIDEKRFENLRFYKENLQQILNAYYDALIEVLEDEKIQQRIHGHTLLKYAKDAIHIEKPQDLTSLLVREKEYLEKNPLEISSDAMLHEKAKDVIKHVIKFLNLDFEKPVKIWLQNNDVFVAFPPT